MTSANEHHFFRYMVHYESHGWSWCESEATHMSIQKTQKYIADLWNKNISVTFKFLLLEWDALLHILNCIRKKHRDVERGKKRVRNMFNGFIFCLLFILCHENVRVDTLYATWAANKIWLVRMESVEAQFTTELLNFFTFGIFTKFNG